jgi:hypothetical protein
MKSTKIIYWTATGLLALMMVLTAYSYLTSNDMRLAFQHLGYPDYFRVELAIAKLGGAALLLAPVSRTVKEWTYAGFAITFIAAFIAHMASGDPVVSRVMPFVFLAVLGISYYMYRKINNPVAIP